MPIYAYPFFYRGNKAISDGRLDDAIAIFKGLLQSKPNCIEAKNDLALIYPQHGGWDDALAAL